MKANWPCLSVLNIATNNIKREGVRHLSRSNWPLLKSINLSIIYTFRLQPLKKRGMPRVLSREMAKFIINFFGQMYGSVPILYWRRRVSIPKQRALAQAEETSNTYNIYDEGENRLSDFGIRSLGKITGA